MIPLHTRLTLDDLEAAAFRYGGTIVATAAGWSLRTTIGGKSVTLRAADDTAVLAAAYRAAVES